MKRVKVIKLKEKHSCDALGCGKLAEAALVTSEAALYGGEVFLCRECLKNAAAALNEYYLKEIKSAKQR